MERGDRSKFVVETLSFGVISFLDGLLDAVVLEGRLKLRYLKAPQGKSLPLCLALKGWKESSYNTSTVKFSVVLSIRRISSRLLSNEMQFFKYNHLQVTKS